ncbi:MAG: hypothetical protein IKE28_04910 [Solobacterium sp.]|nr:hypothetical protein [Solobacterium sp.]
MNKNYFKYLVRNRKLLIGFFFVLYLVISLFLFRIDRSREIFCSIVMTAVILSLGMAFVLPVLLFSFAMRRNSADVYFALPVSRKEMRLTSLLFAFALCYGYFLITVLIAWLLCGIGTVRLLHLAVILVFFAFVCAAMLVINSFLYLIGNNIPDGIIILAAYTMFPLFAVLAEDLIVSNLIAGNMILVNPAKAWILSPISVLVTNCIAVIDFRLADFNIPYFAAGVLYAFIGWFGLKKEFDERKSERAEHISDHPLAYKTIINCYAALFSLLFASSLVHYPEAEYVVAFVMLLGCYIIATFLYQRKLKLEWKSLALFGAEVIISLAIMVVGWNTRGFGLADQIPLSQGDTLTYEYYLMADQDDLGRGKDMSMNEVHEAYVGFTLAVKTDRIEEHQEVIDLMESYRKKAIDNYYARKEQEYSGYLRTMNSRNGNSILEYTYPTFAPISEEDLRIINRYAEVTVNCYEYYEKWDEEPEKLLEDYLDWRAHQS